MDETYSGNCHGLLVFDTDQYTTCSANSSNEIQELAQISNNLQPGGFEFFDLHLSDFQKTILQQISPQHEIVVGYYSDFDSMNDQIYKFITRFALNNPNEFLATEITKIITNLISIIIASSGREDAEILIRSAKEKPHRFPDWHIDKTHEEIYYGQNTSQLVYILPLNGEATLFYPPNLINRETLNPTFGNYFYVHPYNATLDHDYQLDLKNAQTASFGQGSVHLAGYTNGTVHASPNSDSRLLLIITPSDKRTVLKAKEYA